MKKKCTVCKLEKELDEFCKDKAGKFKVKSRCKKCVQDYTKIYNQENKDTIKKYYKNNKEKINGLNKEWYQNNKEEHNKKVKEYRKINSEKYIEYNKEYVKNNKKYVREYYKKYRNNRYKTDPAFRLRIIMSSRLNDLLKKLKLNKTNSIIKYFGCSLEEFKNYIEKQLKTEWNWQNHGTVWEIDHVKPCSSFDFTKEEDIYKCFHYSNHQVLSVHENRVKSGKIL